MTSDANEIREFRAHETPDTLDLEAQDLLEQIADRESDVRRHTMWALLGVSPGAALPLLLTRDPLGPLVLVLAVVLMTGFELWRLLGAKREVAALKLELKSLGEDEVTRLPRLGDSP